MHVVRRFAELSETFVTDLIRDLDSGGWPGRVVTMSVANRELFPFPPDDRLLLGRSPAPGRRLADRLLLRTSAERRSSWLEPPMAAAGGSLVHAHFGWAAADARLAAKRLGLPLVATFHGSDLTASRGRGRRRDYARLVTQLDHAITVSGFLEDRLREAGFDGPVDVIPGGVRLDEVRFREPRADSGATRLLFVGRQIECKGLDDLLRALPSVIARHPLVHLEVIGDGPTRSASEALALELGLGGAVTFRGAVPKREVIATLPRADVLVAPSRTAAGGQAEGRSVVAMEALAAGLPVVATDNGGLPETIPPLYRHELVPEADPGALAAGLLALLDARENWSERAREGRAWAEREFDARVLADRVGRVYETVLEQRGRRKFASDGHVSSAMGASRNADRNEAARPLVSVIVPARNSAPRIPALLAALESQTLPRGSFEVLIVDDASSDSTLAAIEAGGMARAIRLDAHGGPYVARNEAASAARGEILAFTDTDCDPAPDWLERGVAALERFDVDIVVGRVDMAVDSGSPAPALVDFIRNFDQKASAERGFGATANILVRRSAFETAGGFNASLMAGGDAEFGQRAVATGARLRYADDAVVQHEARREPRQLARKAFRKGFGLAQRNRHADGTAPPREQPWSRPGWYVPHRHLAGFDRIAGSGLSLSPRKLAALHACSYLLFQLPLVAGNIAGTVSERSSLRAASRLK